MNRILRGLLALIVFVQATAYSAQLNDLQAGRVAAIVGQILEGHHFRRTRLDDVASTSFLTNYLNALDYNHMVFLQSDIDGFKAKYGNRLDDSIKSGSIAPAFQIFDVYLERLEERNILVQKLLKQEFDFTKDDEFVVARN